MLTISILGHGAVGLSIGSLIMNAGIEKARINFYSPYKNIASALPFNVFYQNEFTKIDSRFFNQDEVFAQSDILIICLKLYDFENISPKVLEVVPEKATILILSNGLENALLLKDVAQKFNVIECILYLSCIKVKNQVTNYSNHPRIIIDSKEESNPILNSIEFRTLVKSAGIIMEYSKTYSFEAWKKFITTSSINGACIFFDCPPKEIFSSFDKSSFLKSLLIEGSEVAKSEGIGFDDMEITEMFENILSMPENCLPSMFWDFKQKRAYSEIDFLNGKIINHGINNGIATPCNFSVVKKINNSLPAFSI